MRSEFKDIMVVVAIALVAAMMFFGVPAHAQPQCAQIEQVIEGLAAGYGEAIHSRGISGNAGNILLFTDPAGDTWTLIALAQDGMACLVASGTGWETLAPPLAGIEG